MRIEWVNHASFVLEHGSGRLMTDPWLDGPVFDDGVALLSQTAFTPGGLLDRLSRRQAVGAQPE